jgi:hypothetical protein
MALRPTGMTLSTRMKLSHNRTLLRAMSPVKKALLDITLKRLLQKGMPSTDTSIGHHLVYSSQPSPEICEVMNNEIVKASMDPNLASTYESLVNLKYIYLLYRSLWYANKS